MLNPVPILAVVCGIWYIFVVAVQLTGVLQLYRNYSKKPKTAVSAALEPDQLPHVTVLRPIKGLEPKIYECLAATFHQSYPRDRLTTYFCIASATDPAIHTLRRLLKNFPDCDAKIFIEDDKSRGQGDAQKLKLGPNPKIRNISQAYREAKGDIIWILDSNIWVGGGAAARMVDKLCGFSSDGTRGTPYKLVHHLPVVIDTVSECQEDKAQTQFGHDRVDCEGSQGLSKNIAWNIMRQNFGGRLEEMFISSSHAKFYTAINTVSIAPCIVGKSNMFRKSHLDYLTSQKNPQSPGIDFFAHNICEDHLIGDLLWREKVAEEKSGQQRFYKHGIIHGDLAIQPMAGMSISEYIGRRVRWLRVRKWTVPLATLVEPGVEPFLCSAHGAFSTVYLSHFRTDATILSTYLIFVLAWVLSVCAWMYTDSFVYAKLHSGVSIEVNSETPEFVRPAVRKLRHPTRQWVSAWLLRELLALPIWAWACLGGTLVTWRGKQFCVNFDMTVSEVLPHTSKVSTARARGVLMASKERHD